jgi:hypothetical protein
MYLYNQEEIPELLYWEQMHFPKAPMHGDSCILNNS